MRRSAQLFGPDGPTTYANPKRPAGARLLRRLAADRETVGRHAERLLDQAKKVQDILGEHQDTVVIQGYLHEATDRTEPADPRAGHRGAAAFGRLAPRIEPALAQESAEVVVTALRKHPVAARIAIVGHEPALSRLLARFLGIRPGDDRLAFQKGGVALIDLPHGPSAAGQLRWFVKPAILRSLGAD